MLIEILHVTVASDKAGGNSRCLTYPAN